MDVNSYKKVRLQYEIIIIMWKAIYRGKLNMDKLI